MADINNCDGSNFLRSACDAGTGGAGGGGSEFNAALSNGDGIGTLSYDGSLAKTITVNSSVVRNTSDQLIAGGLTIEKLISNGPITGQGLDISGVFSVEGDGSIGGLSPASTNVIAWDGAKWAPAVQGGGATSSNLDAGYALNQSLRTSDEGQLSKLDVTGTLGLVASGSGKFGGGIMGEKSNDDDMLHSSAFYARSANPSISLLDTGGTKGVMLAAKNGGDFGISTLNENGTELAQNFNFTTQGHLGIGNTAPSHNLTLGSATSSGTTNKRLKIYRGADDAGQNIEMGYNGITITRDTNTLADPQSSFDITQSGSDGERICFKIGSDGNVGIGTISPDALLNVEGSGSDTDWTNTSSLAATAPSVLITNTTNTANTFSAMQMIANEGSNNQSFAIVNQATTAGSGDRGNYSPKVHFAQRTASNTFTAAVTINEDGNVGIGTTSPDYKLQVSEDDEDATISVITSDARKATLMLGDTVAGRGRVQYDNADDSLSLYSDYAERLRILAGGNVGIGTTNPVSKLEISGGDGRVLAPSGAFTESLTISGVAVSTGAAGGGGGGSSPWQVDGTTITYTGYGHRVGIGGNGVVQPSAKLELFGDRNSTIRLTNTRTEEGADKLIGGVEFFSRDDSGGGSGIRSAILSKIGGPDGSASYLTFSTSSYTENDVERLRIDKDGNVGIGTSTPENALSIHAPLPYIELVDTDVAATGYLKNSNGNLYFQADAHQVRDGSFIRFDVDTNQHMIISGDGSLPRVGIGTTTPTAALTVAGANADIYLLDGAGVASAKLGQDSLGQGQLQLMNQVGNLKCRLQSSGDSYFKGGNVGIGTDSPEVELHVKSASTDSVIKIEGATQSLRVDQNSIRGLTSNDLSFYTSGNVGQLYLTSDGNVGIGTASPSAYSELTLGNSGSLCLKETTTPTADANFGKIYTKSDNNLYFQDGAGTEKTVSFSAGASWSSAPAIATSAGAAGDRAYDSNYYYVCVATNTWKRTALATW